MKGLTWVFLNVLITLTVRAEGESNPLTYTGSTATSPGLSQHSSTKVFKYSNRQGVTSFSDRAPANRRYQIIEVSPRCYACNPDSMVDWHQAPLYLSTFQGSIKNAAIRYGVDPALIRAVIHAESAFKPDARSSMGALGLMQLMPDTAREMGVIDPLSPDQNIHGGARYLAWLMKKVGGNITLATAAYNAGPQAVERHQGVPPYEETETYVKRVRILHDRYRKALAKSS
ncbi:MAG: lytic transglycosylase domain-containing protein [Halioglobus sp.]